MRRGTQAHMNNSKPLINQRARVEKYLREHLTRELGPMHVYCESAAVCVFPFDKTDMGVVLFHPDYDKPQELLEKLRLAWVQYLISGEKVEV